MTTAAHAILHAFLERSPPEKKAQLLSHLTPLEQESVLAVPKLAGDPILDLQERLPLLDLVDPSWIAPKLRAFSHQEVRLFTSSLSETQRIAVKKQLLLSNHTLSLGPLAIQFLQSHLISLLTQDIPDLLPLSCLPDSPLNVLIHIPLPKLLFLISLWGMHDVAPEIKQIIDTVKLRALASALSKEQVAYAKLLAQKKEPVMFKRLGLITWDGNVDLLQALIFQRGLNRLGKALYGANPSILWYIVHRFEVKTGEELQHFTKPLEHSAAHEVLLEQLTSLISHLHLRTSS